MTAGFLVGRLLSSPGMDQSVSKLKVVKASTEAKPSATDQTPGARSLGTGSGENLPEASDAIV